MGSEFTPVFLFILVAILTAIGMVVTSHYLGPRKATPVKQMPYESGMDPIGDARQRFDVRYYLVAIVFLLFDVELLYLYPWAVAQWGDTTASAPAEPATTAEATAGGGATVPATAAAAATTTNLTSPVGIPSAFRDLVLGEILVFIAVLTAAFTYAWRKGVFAWR